MKRHWTAKLDDLRSEIQDIEARWAEAVAALDRAKVQLRLFEETAKEARTEIKAERRRRIAAVTAKEGANRECRAFRAQNRRLEAEAKALREEVVALRNDAACRKLKKMRVASETAIAHNAELRDATHVAYTNGWKAGHRTGIKADAVKAEPEAPKKKRVAKKKAKAKPKPAATPTPDQAIGFSSGVAKPIRAVKQMGTDGYGCAECGGPMPAVPKPGDTCSIECMRKRIGSKATIGGMGGGENRIAD